MHVFPVVPGQPVSTPTKTHQLKPVLRNAPSIHQCIDTMSRMSVFLLVLILILLCRQQECVSWVVPLTFFSSLFLGNVFLLALLTPYPHIFMRQVHRMNVLRYALVQP